MDSIPFRTSVRNKLLAKTLANKWRLRNLSELMNKLLQDAISQNLSAELQEEIMASNGNISTKSPSPPEAEPAEGLDAPQRRQAKSLRQDRVISVLALIGAALGAAASVSGPLSFRIP